MDWRVAQVVRTVLLSLILILGAGQALAQLDVTPPHQYGVAFYQTRSAPTLGTTDLIGYFTTLPLPPPFDVCSYTFRPGSAYPYEWDTAGKVYMHADSIGCFPRTFNLDVLLWQCGYSGSTYAARPSISMCVIPLKSVDSGVLSSLPRISLVNGHLSLDAEADVSLSIELFDVLGRQLVSASQTPGSCSTPNLPKGTYLYRITCGESVWTGKVVSEP